MTLAPGSLAAARTPRSVRGMRLAGAMAGSVAVSLAVVVSSWTAETSLGAPLFWPWLLTGLQVVALWSAGRKNWWGWLLGASVQLPWIVYAVVTGQLGFIPGCAISGAVQVRNFLRSDYNPMAGSDHAADAPMWSIAAKS